MPKRPNLFTEQQNEENEMYIRCRTLRHAWEAIGGGQRRPLFGELATLRCIFCGTLGYDKFSRLTGQRLGKRQYDYPDGYRDVGRHDQAWWRAQWADTVSDMIVSHDTPIDNVTSIREDVS